MASVSTKDDYEKVLELDLENSSSMLQQYLDLNLPGQYQLPDYDKVTGSRIAEILKSRPIQVRSAGEVNGKFEPARYLVILNARIDGGRPDQKTPQYCRQNRVDYIAPLILTGCYYDGLPGIGQPVENPIDKSVGEFPIMTYSNLCVLKGKTNEVLVKMGEDPDDFRGYFIYRGVERYIQCQEQLSTGRMLIYNGHKSQAMVHMTVKTVGGTMIIVLKCNEKSSERTGEMEMILTTLKSKSNNKLDPNSGYFNVVRIIRLLGELKKFNYYEQIFGYFYQVYRPNRSFTQYFMERYEQMIKNPFCVYQGYSLPQGVDVNGNIMPIYDGFNQLMLPQYDLSSVQLHYPYLPGIIPTGDGGMKAAPYIDHYQYLKLKASYPDLLPYEGNCFRSEDIISVLKQYLAPQAADKCVNLFKSSIYYSYNGSPSDLVEFNAPIKGRTDNTNAYELYQNATTILTHDLFPHLKDIPVNTERNLPHQDFVERIDLTVHMVLQAITYYLEYRKGFRKLDIRDDWGIKRGVCAGPLLEQLVRSWWFKATTKIRKDLVGKSLLSLNDLMAKIDPITTVMVSSITTNTWGIRGRTKDNVSQTVPRTSWFETISASSNIDVGVPRNKNIPRAIRDVQQSQWNTVCPVFTPDGDNTGILKNKAITASYSTESDDNDIIKWLLNFPSPQNDWNIALASLRYERMKVFVDGYDSGQYQVDLAIPLREFLTFNNVPHSYERGYLEISMDVFNSIPPYYLSTEPIPVRTHKLYVNGKYLGWINVDPNELYQKLVNRRRVGLLNYDVGIIKDDDRINIEMSASRLIFPYYTVDAATQRLNSEVYGIEHLPFQQLVEQGAIEYLTPGEQEYRKVALYKEDMTTRVELIAKCTVDYQVAEENYRLATQGYTDEQINQLLIKSYQYKQQHPDATEFPPEVQLSTNIELLRIEKEEAKRLYDSISKSHPYTHCHLDPQTYLSYVACVIPYLDSNQSPRNTFTIAMLKQASGVYHINHYNRIDDKTKILMFPEQALVLTEISARDKLHCVQQNCRMAIMALPDTEEDNMIINRDALLRGKFRLYKTSVYKASIASSGKDISYKLGRPSQEASEKIDCYSKINKNGLPIVGSYLRQNDCIIGITQTIKNGDTQRTINASQMVKIGEEGVVTKVIVHYKGDTYGTINITVKLSSMHIPEKGDKFTVPNAQKDTIGQVMAASDMPHTRDGIVPDVIYNATCLPSRMTMSFLLMMMGSTAAVSLGKRQNASPHRRTQHFNIDRYNKAILSQGYPDMCEYEMYSAQSGNKLEGTIFMGLCPVLSLKHLAAGKIQARSRGGIKPVTRQPTKGKKAGGGGRIGEMEKDALIGHGASSLVQQCLMKQSAKHTGIYCLKCNMMVSERNGRYKCNSCENERNFGKCDFPHAFIPLQHFLGGACIRQGVTFITQEEAKKRILTRQQQFSSDDSIPEEMEEKEYDVYGGMMDIDQNDVRRGDK